MVRFDQSSDCREAWDIQSSECARAVSGRHLGRPL